MSTKLYVGNLPFDVTEDELRNKLSEHGAVNEIVVIMDKATGRPRGFAFATMNTPEAATAAIGALNTREPEEVEISGARFMIRPADLLELGDRLLIAVDNFRCELHER